MSDPKKTLIVLFAGPVKTEVAWYDEPVLHSVFISDRTSATGRGKLHFTGQLQHALTFESKEEALEFYGTVALQIPEVLFTPAEIKI